MHFNASHGTPLGTLSAREFLSRHWQKKPLMVRQAFPGFAGLLDAAELVDLACRDDARARVVIRRGRKWEAHNGPFTRSFFRKLPPRGWSLLVNDVNHVRPNAVALLRAFSFIPRARFDDLMVSFAPAGAGVGPHFDSYDVFLLQGPGRRRWQVSRQRDLRLVDNAPLKLLRHFKPEEEWLLDPGDMLYVPPGWCHNGVAVNACMTYSIGFRAPAWQEVGVAFLRHLEDQLVLRGRYADPHLRPARRPGQIPADMLAQTADRLSKIRWRSRDVTRFLGEYLTEPKHSVYFDRPAAPVSRARFTDLARRQGVVLDLMTQLLYVGSMFFINGELAQVKGRATQSLRELADTGELTGVDSTIRGLVAILYEWYGAGYLSLRS